MVGFVDAVATACTVITSAVAPAKKPSSAFVAVIVHVPAEPVIVITEPSTPLFVQTPVTVNVTPPLPLPFNVETLNVEPLAAVVGATVFSGACAARVATTIAEARGASRKI